MDDLIAEINKNRRILEFRFVEGTIKPVSYTHLDVYKRQPIHQASFHQEIILHIQEVHQWRVGLMHSLIRCV